MTPERWQHVKQVLQSALEYEPAQQAAFLASACADDEDLRREVESLLGYQEQGANFIETSAVDVAAKVLANERADAEAGRRVGPYRIVREIGRGGMGAVYLAVRDDEQYQQQVAIKLVKRGMDSDYILRRFRHERQILADLSHPNIARLLDGGTTDNGLPFFVMEYVEGVPIDEYANEHKLPIVERLKLFCVVCAAIAHAHRHLVVHRDIKPGNILVTADGTPMLLDFGIAKLLDHDQEMTATNVTATAVRLMTPEYASPEQLRGEPVSTATDVYSLGVLLYELLTGHRPYRFKSRLPHDVARVVCEQEPPRPSQSIADGGTRNAESKANPQSAIRNPQSLRGDLDNIVLMAMRKEPSRRYASIEQFAEDIHRHLEGLPVRARKDTFGYRAGKFIKRHKIGVSATGLMTVTLLAGVVATLWQARVARAERARAERRFNDVRQLANSFVFEFHDAIQNLPGSTPARALVVKRALQYLDSLAQEAGNDPSLQRELATAYDKLGTVQNTPTVAHLGDSAGAMPSHRKAAALREALVAGDSTNLDYQRELLDSYWNIAVLVNVEGDLPRAVEMLRQQLAMREKLLAADPTNLLDRYNQAGSYTNIGVVLLDMGDVAGALENQQRAMTLREALVEVDPSRTRSQRALSISCEHLGFVTDKLGDTERALDLQRRGLEIREALSAADPHNTDLRLMLVSSHEYLGDIFLKKGNVSEAEKHYRRQLNICEELAAADPLSTQYRKNRATALVKIGDVQAQTGDDHEALLNYRAALQVREALVAANAEDTFNRHDLAEAHVKIADALVIMSSITEALENYGKGIEVYESLSAVAPAHAGIRNALADTYWKIGRLHTTIALATKTPNSQKAEHWRAARERFRQSYDIRHDLDGHGISPAYGIDSSAGSPEKIMEEIVRCDAALKKSQNALAATVGR